MVFQYLVVACILTYGVVADPEPYHSSKLDKPYEPSRPLHYQSQHPKPAYEPAYKPAYESAYNPAYQSAYHPPITKPSYDRYQKPEYNYCDPRATPKCALNANTTYCLKDYDYPELDVQHAIESDPLFLRKYADVATQSADHLVDGVTFFEEKTFDYSLYNGNTFDKGNWVGVEGYLCPSDVLYARPLRAKNVNGEWRVIVQKVAHYSQTQRVETCLFPGASCRTLAPCYKSQCVQKYVYHRMLSFDPCDPYKELFIDTYKLPSACSCSLLAKA